MGTAARDVAVVGGGPAGSAAAIFLRQRGHDVLLLDEARFPRDKVCGEGVSPEAWRLLAAMGYQESKWDPAAVSYTGVRGLMQLTADTADFVRAGDRLDARASIFGGAKYLSRLVATIPARIAEPDRTWLAVAAYNVGYGHLEDARILAQQAGRNADQWQNVREFLPLLSQERWYTRTRRGYARGWEPVRYVENVQSYLNILEVAGIGAPAIASASGADPVPEQPAARAAR